MSEIFLGILSALWLGILTSISPCPLATNIAAISYTGRQLSKPASVLLTGMIYTMGRMLLYVMLGMLIVVFLLSVPRLSSILQNYLYRLTGPVLILVGMTLLDLFRFSVPGFRVEENRLRRLDSRGLPGAFLLGVVFALSFCPVSAALFFGSLIPLSIRYDSTVLIPALYGLGTGLPVIVFSALIAAGASSIGKAFDAVTKTELWFRRITGAALILIGLWLTLRYIFRLF